VIAILGGLGAALCFATTTVCASRSTRLIGATSGVAWVMVVGILIAGPAVAVQGLPNGLSWAQAGWLALSGTGNVTGLVLVYRALRTGKVGVVAAITSTEGAVAALISIGAGEPLGSATGGILGVIVFGIVLAGSASDEAPAANGGRAPAVALSLAAACLFGGSIYATGRVSEELPLFWAVLPARVAGLLGLALPLAVLRRLRLSRSAVPFVVAAGLAEVGGFTSYATGARHGIAVSAVLASQFAAISAISAYVLFGERLRRIQIAGALVIAAGVAALTALRA